jgi:hypothetical protein
VANDKTLLKEGKPEVGAKLADTPTGVNPTQLPLSETSSLIPSRKSTEMLEVALSNRINDIVRGNASTEKSMAVTTTVMSDVRFVLSALVAVMRQMKVPVVAPPLVEKVRVLSNDIVPFSVLKLGVIPEGVADPTHSPLSETVLGTPRVSWTETVTEPLPPRKISIRLVEVLRVKFSIVNSRFSNDHL